MQTLLQIPLILCTIKLGNNYRCTACKSRKTSDDQIGKNGRRSPDCGKCALSDKTTDDDSIYGVIKLFDDVGDLGNLRNEKTKKTYLNEV